THNIAPHSEGSLRPGILGRADAIVIGSYDVPQWWFVCDWSDAKKHEPVVVTLDYGSGPNGTLQPVPHANCKMTRVEPMPSTPTPVGGVPTPYPAIVPFFLPLSLTPVPH